MDQWVPTGKKLKAFWNVPWREVRRNLDNLRRDIGFNNFTFYTEWYTNGIKSSLPFLVNHPRSSNVRTKNQWGRDIIHYLHDHGITVGAMLQLYTFEAQAWEKELVLGGMDNRKWLPMKSVNVIADFTSGIYRKRLYQLIKEQLTLFPEFDYLFCEFEGMSDGVIFNAYRRWKKMELSKSLTRLHFADSIRRYCGKIESPLSLSWSMEVQDMLGHFMKQNLATIQKAADDCRYHGKCGLVYNVGGYERYYGPKVIPNKQWWLLPWGYGGCPQDDWGYAINCKMLDLALEYLQQLHRNGYPVCYIGDVTINPCGLDYARWIWELIDREKMAGYLGMGNPTVELGLRFPKVNDERIRQARKLFAYLWPLKKKA